MRQHPLLLATILISLGLAGCASTAEDIMATDKTMRDIVAEKFGDESNTNEGREEIKRPVSDGPGDLAGYTRDALDETRIAFPQLPNPELVMYVYPHMTEDGTPILGYAVPLTMYKSTQYAMPGELGGWEQ